MRNTTPTRARGGSVAVTVDNDGKVFPSVEVRRRHWLGERGEFLEGTAGYTAKRVSISWDESAPRRWAQGLTASVAWSPTYIALVARGDLVFAKDEWLPRGAVSVGAQTTEWRATMVSLMLGIVGLSVAGFLSGSGG